jgi:hypothetical protein
MQVKNERLTGFILLFVGLLLIIGALHLVYCVFTGITSPPEMFKIQSISLSIPSGTGSPVSIELLSGEVVSKFVNMTVWYILMLFVLSAGGKIAGLGVELLRVIKVVVKGSDKTDTFSAES